MFRPARLLGALGAAACLAAARLGAADIVKSDDANALNLGTSWVGGVAPGASDIAVFNSTLTVQRQPGLGADTEWAGIRSIGPASLFRIGNTGTGASSARLTLGASGIDMSTATTNLDIWSRVRLSASQSWNIASGRALQVVGWGVSNADGQLYDVDLGGFTLTKTGAGILTVHNGFGLANGTLVVSAGTFQMNANSSRVTGSRSTATVRVDNGGSFSLWNNIASSYLTYQSVDAIQWDGKILLNGGTFNFSPQNDGAINLRGTIEAAAGTSSVIAWANSSASGTAHQRDISSAFTGTGTVTIRPTTLRLGDRLTLLGDNSGFAGTLAVNSTTASSNRTVRLGAAQSGSAAAAWSVAVDNTLEVHGVDVSLGSLSDAGTLLNSGGAQSTVTVGALGTSTTFSGVINGGSSGFRLIKTGAGTLTLSGTNAALGGGVLLRQGTLSFSNTAAFTGGAITLGDASTAAGTLSLNFTENNTVARTVSNAITVAASAATEVRVGRTTTTSAGIVDQTYSGQITLARDLTLFNGTVGAGQLRFSGKITGTGNLTVAFPGSGANSGIVITNPTNGSNDFVGNIRIGSGAVLQLGTNSGSVSDHIPNASRVIFEAATGTFRLSNAGETVAGLQSLVAGGGAVGMNRTTAGGGAITLTLLQTSVADTLDFSGVISDNSASTESWALNLAKTGAGTQRLSGSASTYAGITTLTGGVLEVVKLADGGANSSLGKSAAAASNLVFNGGTLRYAGTGDSTNRLFTMNAGGSLQASGTGALVLTGTGAIGHGAPDSNRTLTLSGDSLADNSIAAQLADPSGAGKLALAKSGAGLWVVSGANTYSGGTVVNDGTLRAGAASALGTGLVTVAGGTLDLAGLNVSNQIVLSGGALVNAGSWTGTARLSGTISDSYLASLPGTTLSIAAGSAVDLTGLTSLGGKTLVYSGGTLTGSSNVLVEIADGATLGADFGSGRALVKAGRAVTLTSALTRAVRYEGGTLSGLADYAGSLTVGGSSTLDLDGAGNTAVTTAASVTVEAGSTLKGTGTFGGGVIAGVHAPGNSPGIQISQGDLSYSAGASVQWELTANADVQGDPVRVFDQIVVNGNLSFGGPTSLSLVFDGVGSAVDWSDVFWTQSRSWTLYDVSGSLSGYSNLSLSSGDWLDLYGVAFATGRAGSSFGITQSGADVILNYTYQPVPEPSTYGLILGGLALAGAAIRRRRKAA